MKLIIGILAASAALIALAVFTGFITYSPAHASQGAQPPAKPTGLSVSTAQGSLDVSMDWDDVDGAAEYWVRWRFVQPEHRLNEGIRTGSSATTITVADYGEWVVRVEACNDAGCGEPVAKRFNTIPAPEVTPTATPTATPTTESTPTSTPTAVSTPTPEPTPEPTPVPTPEPAPEPTPEFRVSVAADATELKVNEEVTLTAVITNAPAGSGPTYQWQLDLGGGSWYSAGTEATFSYLQNNAGSSAFRVTVTYGSGDSATSGPITITWVPPNREEAEILAVCDRTLQVRDALVALADKACEDIGAEDLAHVVKLDLSDTGLSSLKSRDFSGLISLRDVDVSGNTISQWSDVCGAGKWGTSVQNINLDGNKLGTLITGNTGAAMPGNCFVDAPNLKSLHLAGNRINSLPANAFGNAADSPNTGDPSTKLTNLEWIDLSRNQIPSLDVNVFSSLSNLWYLDLGRNALTKSGLPVTTSGSVVTDAVFDDLSSLEWLALNNQKAQDANDNYEPTGNPTLTGLDTNVFKGLSSLKELDLANNGITSTGLPNNVFTPLSSLESLALFGNDGAPFTLTNKGVRAEASVIQVVTPPTGFTVEPVSGGVKLTWNDPNDTSISHEYRFRDLDSREWSAWTAISSPTDNGATLEHTVSSDLSSGTGYAFQLRSVTSGAHSYRADADCTAIFGTSGNDTLTAGGADCVIGLGGDDTLISGYGPDKLDGGDDTDTVSYRDSPGGVTVSLSITTLQDEHDDPLSAARGDVLSNIENITGSAYNDTLTGDGSANVLTGGKGDDTLDGDGGSDTVSYAGSSAAVTVSINDDTASGGDAQGDTISDFENITGSAYNDTLTGDGSANVLTGGRGNDILEGLAGGDTLWGEAGNDTLSYASSDAAVNVNLAAGTASGGHAAGDSWGGIENLIGSAHADTLTGQAKDNVIEGGAGADTIGGGAGRDTLSYRFSADPVYANFADDEYEEGDAEGDTVSGFENIIGSKGGDELVGDANDNVIEGLAGFDTLNGKGGTDTLSYASSGDSVVVNFAGGNFQNAGTDNLGNQRGARDGGGGHAEGDVISTTTNADGDIIPTFENAIGSDYPDWFIINAAGSKIDGGHSIDDGKSTIYFPGLTGTIEAEFGRGDGGIDPVQWFYLDSGDVVDYRKSDAGVTVNLTTGTNTGGYAQGAILTGIEAIVGSPHADTLTGDKNNNYFYGGAGGDTFDGKGGIDVVDYSWFHDTTQEVGPKTVVLTLDLKTSSNNTWHADGDTFTDIEWFVGSYYNDKITGGDGDDNLSGHSGEDIINGGAGNDTLWGPDPTRLRLLRKYYDQLYGEAGNDYIIVGGADEGHGGTGNDKFLAMGRGWYVGGDGTDEFYFHRNYFPAPAKDGGAGQIWEYADNEDIRICMGSGKGTADGEVSWTTTVEEVAGDNKIDDVVVTVSLQVGTSAVNQGTFLVVDFTDSSKVDIAWSDPNASVGTGCNFVDLDSVPGRTRMIRSEVAALILN